MLPELSRILLGVAVTAALSAAPAAGQDASPGERTLMLQEAVSLASGDQPALEAYALEAAAAEEAASAAETLPDPQLTVGIQNYPVIRGENAWSPVDDDMTMYTIGLMREQVRGSKREARAARIRAEALVSRRQATAEQRRIAREVMLSWISAVEARSKQALLERLIADLRTGREVVEAGVSTGNSTPALALEAQADVSIAEAELAEARTAEAQARAELARWIGSAAQRPLPETLPLIDAPSRVPADLLRIAAHPAIEAAAAEEDAARRQVDVARTDRNSDISWSVMLGVRPKYGEMISGQVSIPLQINRRGRQDRLVAEAQAKANAARLRTEDRRRELQREYQVALATYKGADAELERINRQAIPALQAAFEAAEARYSAGGGTLDQAFEIVRRYVEMNIRSVDIKADRDRAAAQMLYVLGETGL